MSKKSINKHNSKTLNERDDSQNADAIAGIEVGAPWMVIV